MGHRIWAIWAMELSVFWVFLFFFFFLSLLPLEGSTVWNGMGWYGITAYG